MRLILRYLSYAVTLSIGFALFYFKGLSQTTAYTFAAMLIVLMIAVMGSQYGFTKKLPNQKPLTIFARLTRYCFGVITLTLANKILEQNIFETLLSSKNFIIVIWLWIMFEMVLGFMKEYKRETFQPKNSADPKGRAAD